MDSSKTPNDDADALENTGTDDGGSLENSTEVIDATGGGGGASSAADSGSKPASAPSGGGKKPGGFFKRFNFYLIMFMFILVIAGGVIIVAYMQSKQASTTSTLKTQELTQNTLEKVANSDAEVGNTQQVLNVRSSAVFAGKVLVRQDLEVAGSLQIGGTVGLQNLTVSGTTQLGQTQINKDLEVAGDTALQGSVSIAKSLQVKGGASFGGPISAPQITTSNLQLNSDLTLTHHIIVGGGTPSRSAGSALGGGGSVAVGGSDTAGTVTINTGNSPGAGCFVTVNFTQKYSSTPHILITPVGSAAGSIAYYVNRTTTGFSICDSAAPPAGSSFAFDYFVID